MIKGSLLRKLLSYGWLSFAAFSPSCQPHYHHHYHHHQVDHQVVGKCSWSGTREFRLERLSGDTLCFSGKVAFAVAEVGSLFPRVRASICKSCRQSVHRTVARARIHIKIVKKKLRVSEHFWKMRSANLLIYWFIDLWIYWFIHSFTHSLVHSFLHSVIHSFLHSVIHSVIHSSIMHAVQFNLVQFNSTQIKSNQFNSIQFQYSPSSIFFNAFMSIHLLPSHQQFL
jgi:hypothetical protein